MRTMLVAGNWKMNGSLAANEALIGGLKAADLPANVEVLVCPPAAYLAQVQALNAGSAIKLGAQNVSEQASGAFTGELALSMLAEFDVSHVLVGHSERRSLYGETDDVVAAKVAAVLANSEATAVLCVGETLQERESGQTEAIVGAQVNAVLDKVGPAAFSRVVVAYEPVWAIGTGKTATPEMAQEVHAFIRAEMAKRDADIAAKVQILYGGSVKASSAAGLFAQPDIDGGLVGGASLSSDEFAAICQAAA